MKIFKLFYGNNLFYFLLGFVDDKYNLKANLKFIFLFIIILILLFKDFNLILNEINFSL